jgi:hypothetical protein
MKINDHDDGEGERRRFRGIRVWRNTHKKRNATFYMLPTLGYATRYTAKQTLQRMQLNRNSVFKNESLRKVLKAVSG